MPAPSLLSALLALLCSGAFAQATASDGQSAAAPEWVRVEAPTDANLYAVHFADPRQGWIVGQKGLILHTEDGGKTWIKQDSGLTNSDLYSVFFLDSQNGWTCGDIGDGPQTAGHVVNTRPLTAPAFLKTADGGKTWQKVAVGTNFVLTDIWMSNKNHGVVVTHGGPTHADGDLFVTGDATQWSTVRAFRGMQAVQLLSDKIGFAVGGTVSVGFFPAPQDPLFVERRANLIKTEDGGQTWAPCVHPALGQYSQLLGLFFVDSKNGWACGLNGAVLHTDNGGQTWDLQVSGVQTPLRDVHAVSPERVWLFGYDGAILRSTDSGKTWKKEFSVKAQLRRAWFTSERHGVAVGFGGMILRYGQ
jgi:photosystem II stability/assembly factor-like uncharacterized protein